MAAVRVHVPVGSCVHEGCEVPVYARSRTRLCRRHQTQAWKKANPDRVNAHNRRYREAHPEQARAWEHQSIENRGDAHRQGVADRAAVRRARKAGQFVEKVYRAKVLRLGDGLCGLCGEPVDPARFDVDHIVPLAHGGLHSYTNTQPAHPLCNQRKGSGRR